MPHTGAGDGADKSILEPPELLRRCHDCRRVVHGHAGNACPWCGGGKLETPQWSADAPPARVCVKHASILTFAITLCVGLLLLRPVLMLIEGPYAIGAAAYAQTLLHVQVITVAATAVYLLLRRSEGDSRALFILSFGLFIATEGLSALARNYGVLPLSRLAAAFNLSLFIFSSLSMTAAVADGYLGDRNRRALLLANLGFTFVAVLHAIFELKDFRTQQRGNLLAAGVLLFLVLCIGAILLRGDKKRVPPAQAAGQAEPAGAAIATASVEKKE